MRNLRLTKPWCLFGAILSAMLACPAHANEQCEAQGATIVGTSTSLKTGALLYCERHYSLGANKWRVDYVQDDAIVVQKHLDFSASSYAPTVRQRDSRTGELREAVVIDGVWNLTYQDTSVAKPQLKAFDEKNTWVIDAGFDNYVRQSWTTLTAGNEVVFEFASIPHLKSLSLRAQVKAMDFCIDEAATLSEGLTCVVVGADSRWLRLFMGNLTLIYDSQQRLLVFRGPVNIQGNSGKSQEAKITYRYIDH